MPVFSLTSQSSQIQRICRLFSLAPDPIFHILIGFLASKALMALPSSLEIYKAIRAQANDSKRIAKRAWYGSTRPTAVYTSAVASLGLLQISS
jgi:hypothetical protein